MRHVHVQKVRKTDARRFHDALRFVLGKNGESMTCDCCNKGEENAGIILRALAFIKDEKARLNKSAQIQESYLVGYEKKTWFDKENSRAIAKDAMHKRDLVKSLREIENILLGGELE